MRCADCRYPIHEQFKNYPGRWLCFHPGDHCGRAICKTPVSEWNDFIANNQRLAEAKTPKWCPGFSPKAGLNKLDAAQMQ